VGVPIATDILVGTLITGTTGTTGTTVDPVRAVGGIMATIPPSSCSTIYFMSA